MREYDIHIKGRFTLNPKIADVFPPDGHTLDAIVGVEAETEKEALEIASSLTKEDLVDGKEIILLDKMIIDTVEIVKN
ncbi:MAG: hypothetical protein LIR50_11905 [Bacillota bacterium]|nr:hypothetical protein [Bacillota bacterium]